MSTWLRAAALLAVLAIGAGCGSGSPDRPPGDGSAAQRRANSSFVGITSEDAFATGGAYRRRQFASQVRAGVGLVRQTFAWSRMEVSPGDFDLATYDSYIAAAARAGLTVMPILFDPPAFREQQADAAATTTTTAPPRSLAAMARWATVLVRRYGSDGSLWREQPDLPERPILKWQVWNEPNLPAYWNARPSAREYARMLKVVGDAIRGADRKASIVTAGLPESRLGIGFSEFVRQMYAAGAAGSFDVLAINAYSRTVSGIQTAVAGARRITAAAEDGDVAIMLTEFGWATRPAPRGSFTVSRRRQARLVSQTITTLARERERLRIAGVVYYQWRDAPVYAGGVDYWGLHTGLRDIRGRPKPSLPAFAKAARAVREG